MLPMVLELYIALSNPVIYAEADVTPMDKSRDAELAATE
jgi:hypothetical protein